MTGRLIYTAIASLDGYTNDRDGNFDWAAPDEELHAFVNDQERPIGTYLLGRRMYETMVFWETVPTGPDQNAVMRDYAQIWRAADKVVYSSTLDDVTGERTRIERSFDPGVVAALKESATSDLSVGGPGLAAAAFRAGLVDVIRLILTPHVVGGGTAALPTDVRLRLELLEERRFGSGVVSLEYAVR